MKFLVDAQLPRRLALKLVELVHDATHTLDLSDGNDSTDQEICQIADSEDRIVVTKDSDFVDSFHLQNTPTRLLLISTGNINNNDLLDRISESIETIGKQFNNYDFLELNCTTLIIHE